MELEACNQREDRIESENTWKFSLMFYFQTLTRLLSSSGRFFTELPDNVSMRPALGCLLISSLFFVGADLTQPHDRPLLMAIIGFTNALVMCFISAAVGFGAMTMTLGRRVSFQKFFSVYAFAASVTLLAAWIPLFVWLTEPWKWVLIAVGLVKGCGLRWFQAVMVIGISIFVLVLFFWSLGPVIVYIRG